MRACRVRLVVILWRVRWIISLSLYTLEGCRGQDYPFKSVHVITLSVWQIPLHATLFIESASLVPASVASDLRKSTSQITLPTVFVPINAFDGTAHFLLYLCPLNRAPFNKSLQRYWWPAQGVLAALVYAFEVSNQLTIWH